MKKNRKSWLSILLVICLLFTSVYMPSKAEASEGNNTIMKTFYVSPDGNDGNNGLSSTTPFQSINKAKLEVQKYNSGMTGDIVVYIMDGTYELDSTITFEAIDSGSNGIM